MQYPFPLDDFWGEVKWKKKLQPYNWFRLRLCQRLSLCNFSIFTSCTKYQNQFRFINFYWCTQNKETDALNRKANCLRLSLCRIQGLPRSEYHISDTSNRPTTDYLNQRTVRDRPCAVWGGVQPRYVGDPYPPADVHRSRCVGICIRLVWVPDALVSSNVWCCKAYGMSVLLHFVFRSFYAAYCLLLTMVYKM